VLVEIDRRGRTRTLPLCDIREIRLHMAGTESDVDHIVVITPRSGRAMHLVDQEGNMTKDSGARRTTWAEFTAELLRRTAAAGGGTAFVAGPDASAKWAVVWALAIVWVITLVGWPFPPFNAKASLLDSLQEWLLYMGLPLGALAAVAVAWEVRPATPFDPQHPPDDLVLRARRETESAIFSKVR